MNGFIGFFLRLYLDWLEGVKSVNQELEKKWHNPQSTRDQEALKAEPLTLQLYQGLALPGTG